MFQSFNDDDSDVVRLLLSATDAAEEEVDVTAGNDRYTPSFQPSDLSEAKALRQQARLNLPAAFSSYFTTRSSG